MLVLKLIGICFVVALGGFLWRRVLRGLRRRRLLDESIKPKWSLILEKNFPLYNRLPEQLKAQLGGLVNVFLAEKRFQGCGGLEITDEVRVTIAGQACVLLLNRKTP